MGGRQPIVVRTPDLRTDLPPAEAERVRLAVIKRARKAQRVRKGMPT